jgi:hypothetical protein
MLKYQCRIPVSRVHLGVVVTNPVQVAVQIDPISCIVIVGIKFRTT